MQNQTDNTPNDTYSGYHGPPAESAKHTDDDDPVGNELDLNTTYDVIVSPTGFVTELSDTIDSLEGTTTEVIDIVNEADGTNIELTIVEEPTSNPGVDSVDRFVEINGIGPEVAKLLTQAGIRRFSELAETPVERIREILTAAGVRYRIHEAATWPWQAKQFADNKEGESGSFADRQRVGRA